MNNRELFLRHVAQTSPAPIGLEIVKAKGMQLFTESGKAYMDLISGISVANTGHGNPIIIEAIKKQADDYLHVLVYGECIQSPQVKYATLLAASLPAALNCVYFTNSGAEAVEGAMKLAKRVTGRSEIIAFKHAYHGSTQGALSIIGDEYWRNAYRPLLPGVHHLEYNSAKAIERIDSHTACVIVETVQGEAGVIKPGKKWLQSLKAKCTEAGALLILDEIQTGFGRTGTLWGFEQYHVFPDILVLGKALGGGMPLGAFVADRKIMVALTDAPVLGHITTFGGHPVSCAAGLAAFQFLVNENLPAGVKQKESLFQSLLIHQRIKELRVAGLLIAVEFDSFDFNKKVIDRCLEKGLLTDWFLFAPQCLRIAPPLIIEEEEIRNACSIILDSINSAESS